VVGGGEVLQPVLYSLVVEAALGHPVAEARLFYATSRGGFSDRVVPINDLTRRYGLEVLEIIDRAVSDAALPPAPRAKACDWCDFRPICGPGEEERSARKDRTLIADLDELRSLP
jgi:CRISPR/Cas system-associated exonuclease Cas4 (RecB family)